MNTFSEYTQLAERTMMDSCRCAEYLDSGLIAEVGELCGLYAKSVRGDYDLMERSRDVLKEAGDCCLFVAMKVMASNYELSDVIEIGNLEAFNSHAMLCFHAEKSLSDLFENVALNAIFVVELAYDKKSFHRHVTMFFAALSALLGRFGYTLAEAMDANIEKLTNRKELGNLAYANRHGNKRS